MYISEHLAGSIPPTYLIGIGPFAELCRISVTHQH